MRKLGLKKSLLDFRAPRFGALRYAKKKARESVVNRPDPNARMLLNDILSDCTAAGMGNSLSAVSALQGWKLDISDKNALEFYEGSSGFDPSKGNDNGCTGPDALNFAVNKGFNTGNGRYYGIWGNIDSDDQNGIANTIGDLGVCAFGVDLSLSDMKQIDAENDNCVLTKDNTKYGDNTPGSAGGHFLLGYEYTGLDNNDVVTLITWGETTVKCTWDWLKYRIVEAHGIIWPQLRKADGSYCGEDFDAVIEECKHYAAS